MGEAGEVAGDFLGIVVAKNKVGDGERNVEQEVVEIETKDEVGEVGRKIGYWRVEVLTKNKVGDSSRERGGGECSFNDKIGESQRERRQEFICEPSSRDEMGKRGREAERMVEVFAANEVSQVWGEIVDRLIERTTESQMGDGSRKVVDRLIQST